MKIPRFAYPLIAFTLAFAFTAAAEAQPELLFVLHDLDQPGNPLIGEVAPDETLDLGLGQRLRVSAVTRSESGETSFLRARFWLSDERHVAVEEVDTGVAILQASADRPGFGVLHYELEGRPDVARSLRTGTLRVEVSEGGAPIGNRDADEILASLYRGILLREPDGSQSERIRLIEREGYPAVVRIAREIAVSRESRIDVYERSCNEQRLLALYRELLGRERDEIALEQWDRDLDRLDDRRYADVVEEMVGSREFLARFDLGRRERVVFRRR